MINSKHENKKRTTVFNKLFFLVMLFLLTFNHVILASEDLDSVINDLNNGSGVYGTIREIMQILAMLGFAIAVFQLVHIGILLLISGGSKRSDAKSALFPWLVGAFVCITFGTIGPWVIGLIMGGSSGSVFDI